MHQPPVVNIAVIIPWRDRGGDPLRKVNLERVLEHWAGYGQAPVIISDDGRGGDEQFNRSAAYNRGTATALKFYDAHVLVYAEADMLIDYLQLDAAAAVAVEKPGLVVPFRTYRYLTPEDSARVRSRDVDPTEAAAEFVVAEGRSIGAINVISRTTYETIGRFDEKFEGNWYDDSAMCHAFSICAGPTRWIDGLGHHLYHLPGHTGEHLSAEDRAATARNRQRYQTYLLSRTPEQIRTLTAGRCD